MCITISPLTINIILNDREKGSIKSVLSKQFYLYIWQEYQASGQQLYMTRQHEDSAQSLNENIVHKKIHTGVEAQERAK